MSQCRECGVGVEAGNVLCPSCAGTPLSDTSRITCSECGSESVSSVTRCFNCGGQLYGQAEPASIPTVEQSARVSKPTHSAHSSIAQSEADYDWEFVPFAPRLKAGILSVESAAAISRQLSAIVETYQSRGWQYVRLEQVDVTVAVGCLAALFGRSSSTVSYDIIVFRAVRTSQESPPGSGAGQSGARAAYKDNEESGSWDPDIDDPEALERATSEAMRAAP